MRTELGEEAPGDLFRTNLLDAVYSDAGMFRDNTAFITGVKEGNIVLQLALALLRRGCRVVVQCFGDDEEALLKGSLKNQTDLVKVIGADYRVIDEAIESARTALDELGVIDFFIHGAGLTEYFDRLNETDAEYDAISNIKHRSFRAMLCEVLIPHMLERSVKERGMAKVVGLTSVHRQYARHAPDGLMTSDAYADANELVVRMVKDCTRDYGHKGINFNAIQLGHFANDRLFSSPDELAGKDATLASVPCRAIGEPQEFVGAVFSLIGPLSDYINGSVLAIDGGFHLTKP